MQINAKAKEYISALETDQDSHPLGLLGTVTGRFTTSSVVDVYHADRDAALIDLDMLRYGCPLFKYVYWFPNSVEPPIPNKELAQKLKDFMTKEAGLKL